PAAHRAGDDRRPSRALDDPGTMSGHVSTARPYPAGWLDRLGDWVDRSPGPNAVYCLALLLVEVAYLTGLLWMNGRVPVGSIDFRDTFIAVVAPYLLWVRFHLD